MPPIKTTKKSKESSRDQTLRWKSSEIVPVLKFLNENFDMWYINHRGACVKAIEATNIIRDAKSIYNKVHSLIRAMQENIKTGKKSSANAIIWEDEEIHDLVKKICEKTQERKNRDNRMSDSDDTTSNIDEVSSVPFSTEAVEKLYEEKLQYINQQRTKLIETVAIANSTFQKSNVPIPYSLDTIEDSCNEKTNQVKQLRTELLQTIEVLNKKYEMLKNFN
ncbi:hypothetical protein C1645_738595 [Glomus cerebriforme]|uniref:Uncharacterized protein n=1 Tax=Glomus cerebriforme TaxID=658196 RepID=A0A397SUY1_9GLOM|nr:hypothetical protein C1645_738595 [Glomus cerebriforme]